MKAGSKLVAALAAACAACSSGGNTMDAGTGNVVEVIDDIRANTEWKKDKIYVLKAAIAVEGATLTIEAGTTIKGDAQSVVLVTPTGRLVAVGTKTAPIVFTSNKPDGTRTPGDWGGIVLLGNAPTNLGATQGKIEGFPARETRTVYGGSDAAHDCGRLEYVRIEFAGQKLTTDNELNELTLGGCGSGTVIDFVQLHRGLDDGIEIFGGTANIKHVLVTYPDDDGLDWDRGWVGRGQFIAVVQSAERGNHGIEADNQTQAADNVTTGNPDATPRSNPELWNVTILGSNAEPNTAMSGGMPVKQRGIALRSATDANLNNFIITQLADFPVDVQSSVSGARVTGGTATLKNSIFWDNANLNDSFPAEPAPDSDGVDENALFTATALSNRFADPMLGVSAGTGAAPLKPAVGSPALNGGGTPPTAFDSSATFVGAMDATTDWTEGWTAYPAN